MLFFKKSYSGLTRSKEMQDLHSDLANGYNEVKDKLTMRGGRDEKTHHRWTFGALSNVGNGDPGDAGVWIGQHTQGRCDGGID